MPLSIKIVTTANNTRQLHQSDRSLAKATIDRLIGSGAVFAAPSLIVSSGLQTEVFSPKRIAIIELDSESGVSESTPVSDLQITALDLEQGPFAYDLEPETGQRFKVDFYFVGGFLLNAEVVLSGTDASKADRTRRVAQIFEQQVIIYQTAKGGIGLLNPLAMTRAVITPRSEILPADTLIVDDY